MRLVPKRSSERASSWANKSFFVYAHARIPRARAIMASISLSPSKVRKAREAINFLSSLSGSSEAGPSGLASEGCSDSAGPVKESSTSKKGKIIIMF